MKKDISLEQVIYLPEHFTGRLSESLQKENSNEILYWDFTNVVNDKVKQQIELLLNHIIKTVKDREARRNKYLFPLKYLLLYAQKTDLQDILKMELSQEKEYVLLVKENMGDHFYNPKMFIRFCREVLFLQSEEIEWDANVWFVERLQIEPHRYSQGGTLQSFSFLEIMNVENRTSLQRYVKYMITVTTLKIGTIRILYDYAKEFVKYLEIKSKLISQSDVDIVKDYFKILLSQRGTKPQSHNNKIKGVTDFLLYLQAIKLIQDFPIPWKYFQKKVFPEYYVNTDLEEKLDLFSECVNQFPRTLFVMSCILLYTGIGKGQMFLLKDTDFYWKDNNSWMCIPEENREIPIPMGLHLQVLLFIEYKKIPLDSNLFLNNSGKRYTYQSFQCAIMKQCKIHNILDGEYIFKRNGYQIAFCRYLYRQGVSLQAIREYMGYSDDEILKKNLGIMEDKVLEASRKYFAQEGHRVGREFLMAKYDKMIEKNRQESEKKVQLAIQCIEKFTAEDKKISVTELVKETGLARSIFYKNEQIRKALDESKKKQDPKQIANIHEKVKNMSLERQNAYYERKIREIVYENEALKKENEKLRKKLANRQAMK